MHEKITSKDVFSYYWSIIKKYPQFIIGILISVPIGVLSEGFVSMLVLARVIERLSTGDYQEEAFLYGFGTEFFVYVALLLLGTIGWRLIDTFTWRLEGRATKDIAQQTYNHLMSQSANFHANNFTGSLVSQTNKLLGSYVRIADTTIYQVMPTIIGITFTIILLWGRSPAYVTMLTVLSIIYIASGWFVTRKTRELSAAHARSESRQTGYLADSVTNVMAIKSFSNARTEMNRFGEVTEHTRSALMRLHDALQRQMLFYSLLNRSAAILALLTTLISVVRYDANVATAFLVFTYTNTIVGQLWQFCNSALKNYNRSIGDASEMIGILKQKPEVQDPIKPKRSKITKGRVAFDNVTFTHKDAGNALFNNLDLDIKPGEKVGLVGHSGSGKTTLSRILLRFSDIDSGTIAIDSQNIAEIPQDELRSHIAYVPQEPLLFHRSLYENIAYGKPDASREEVERVAELAHAHEFIKDLPKGYDTLVGERGVKLSGGQRQRVAIARAMIKNAPVLLLDEATSALDSESEKLIQDALWKLMEGRTAIVIAHRLSTIQKMDRIIVLDHGTIIEQGSHAELLKKKGVYADLWNHQSGGFIEE